jgi:hypothetical protein
MQVEGHHLESIAYKQFRIERVGIPNMRRRRSQHCGEKRSGERLRRAFTVKLTV